MRQNHVRNVEVGGSSPLTSTHPPKAQVRGLSDPLGRETGMWDSRSLPTLKPHSL
jgi:hypothetical protein